MNNNEDEYDKSSEKNHNFLMQMNSSAHCDKINAGIPSTSRNHNNINETDRKDGKTVLTRVTYISKIDD